MTLNRRSALLGLGAGLAAPWVRPSWAQAGTVYVYNWADYIGETTLEDFSTETGVEVVYDMYASMEEMQAKLSALEIQGQAGAGMVQVTLNGKGEMRSILIDPKLVGEGGDAEMLQDLVLAAHNDAKRKVEANSQDEMQKLTAGLPIPPGMKLPF